MKRNIFLFMFLAFFTFVIFANDTGKTKMAILPFFIKGNIDANLSGLFYDNFISAINDGGKYSNIDKNSIEKAFNILKIQKNIEFSEQNAIDIGTTVRARVVITGSVTSFENEFFVSIRAIDVDSGKELFKERDHANSNSGFLKLADSLAKSIPQSGAGVVANAEVNKNKKNKKNKNSIISDSSINNGHTNENFRPVSFFLDNSKEYGFGTNSVKFMTKNYAKWNLSPEDYHGSMLMYKQLWSKAKGLIISGAVLGALLGIGFFWLPFCAIPIYQASLVRYVYTKATGVDLLASHDNNSERIVLEGFSNDFISNDGKKIKLSLFSWEL